MQLEDLTLVLFAACNGIRLFAYVPQIYKAATDLNGASAVSSATWGLFLLANLSTIAYALINRADWWLAACFVGNALGCVTILATAHWKARRHARKTAHPYPHRNIHAHSDPRGASRLELGISEGTMTRFACRQFMYLAAGAGALPAVSCVAWGQAYPTRPVRLVVPFAAGGATDIVARMMGQWLSERLGQQFVIENRPGGGTNIGTEAVVKAAADGYTLLVASTSAAINASLYDKLNFNFVRDIAPVGGLVRVALVMVVNPALPVKTLPQFIEYAKANPGKINMASAGNGSAPHVAGELFKIMTGLNMAHIPYRGGAPALTDLMGGQVQIYFASISEAIEYIRADRVRALAVTTPTRADVLPDVATVAEFVPGYEASTWFGIGAPRNTPTEIVDKLNKEINAAISDPRIRTRLVDMGGNALVGTPADFAKLVADETEKWAKVVKFAGLRPD
jgi:tripartite-type tricarboxylate transporter receptor subunit TctC